MPELDNQLENNPAPQKQKKGIFWIATVALVGILLVLLLINVSQIQGPFDALSSILAPISVGLVLAYFLNFFLRFFEYKLRHRIKRRKVNRAISMLLAYIFLLALIGGILLLILPNLIDNVENLPQMRNTADSFIIEVQGWVRHIFAEFELNIPGAVLPYLISPDALYDELQAILTNWFSASGDQLVGSVITVGTTAITVLKNIVVGIFISIYVLLSKERLNAGCRRVLRALLPKKAEEKALYYVGQAHTKIGGYLVGKTLDSTMVMLVCMLLFTIFKIPTPILIAVIIGVTDFIPFFGPFIGAIPSAIIIFFMDPPKVIMFAILILVVQQIDGNLIAPIILGNKTGLSSLGVIIAITVMGGVFGIIGMLIGVPIFALGVVILDDFIKARLEKKGEPTALRKYYPADAFIKPQDESKNELTLTKRFVRWVASVETEVKGVDYTPSRRHTVGRGIRRFFLAIGRFFQRLFSVKPIADDQAGTAFYEISKTGMRHNHRFWHHLVLALLTVFLYPLYFVGYMAQRINIACRQDDKRTWGTLPFAILSVFTLGIFPIVWHSQVIRRFNTYCSEHGETCCISRRFYLLWTLPGLLTLVGPLIALARFLRAYNQMCRLYNAQHTFPLSAEEIEAEQLSIEQAILSRKKRRERNRRRSLLEEVTTPHTEEASLEAVEAIEQDGSEESVEQLSIDDAVQSETQTAE